MTDTIKLNDKGQPTVYSGFGAVDIFRAKVLKSSLNTYAKCGLLPTRGVSISKMLAFAAEYTGKKYKRGDALKAAADLEAVIVAKLGTVTIETQKAIN